MGTGWSWEMLSRFENKIMPICWESHIKWETDLVQWVVEQQSGVAGTQLREAKPGVPPAWGHVVSTVAPCRGSEGLCPGLLPVDSLTLRLSVLPTAGCFCCPLLGFQRHFQTRECFCWSSILCSPGRWARVLMALSWYLELILISGCCAVMLSLPWASMSWPLGPGSVLTSDWLGFVVPERPKGVSGQALMGAGCADSAFWLWVAGCGAQLHYQGAQTDIRFGESGGRVEAGLGTGG